MNLVKQNYRKFFLVWVLSAIMQTTNLDCSLALPSDDDVWSVGSAVVRDDAILNALENPEETLGRYIQTGDSELETVVREAGLAESVKIIKFKVLLRPNAERGREHFVRTNEVLEIPPLACAIRWGKFDTVVDTLMQDGAEPNDLFYDPLKQGNVTVLSEAISKVMQQRTARSLEVVQNLLLVKADPNAFNERLFHSHLTQAVATGSVPLVQMLLKAGASVDGSGWSGMRPLGKALEDPDMLRCLAKAGANLNHRMSTNFGNFRHVTLLAAARLDGNEGLAALLKELKADDAVEYKLDPEEV